MKIFGTHDEQTMIQFQHVRENAVDAALMADASEFDPYKD